MRVRQMPTVEKKVVEKKVKKLIKKGLEFDLMGSRTHKNIAQINPWTKSAERGFMTDFVKVANKIVDQSQRTWAGSGDSASVEYETVTAKMEKAKEKYEEIMGKEYSVIDTLKKDLGALTDIIKGANPLLLKTEDVCQGLEVYIANQKGYYKEGGEYKKNPDDIQKVWNVVSEYLKGLEQREGVTNTKRNKVQTALLEFMVEPTEKNKTEIINQLNSKKKMYRGPVIRAIKSKAGFGGYHQTVVEKLQDIQLSDQPSQELSDQLHRRSFADALKLNREDEGGPRIDPTAHEHEGPKGPKGPR